MTWEEFVEDQNYVPPPMTYDAEDELWECLQLLKRCQGAMTAVMNRNASKKFLPQKQQKEFRELEQDLYNYLGEWNL